MKKRNIIILIVILIITSVVISLFMRKKDYEIVYIKDNYIVKESYKKDNNSYYFNIHDDEYSFDFLMNIKRLKEKQVISKIESITKDKYLCLTITVDDSTSDVICSDGLLYVDSFIAGVNTIEADEKKSTKNNVDIYDESHDYYVWNGYGIKNIIDNKEYKFLKNESYDNSLSYKLNDYIIFANYDDERETNILYIFDYNKKKMKKWKIKYNISFDSYFLGNLGNDIYLFDKKNEVEYRINPEKKKIKIVSKNEMGIYFNEIWDKLPLNKFTYNNLQFKYNNNYNYILENGILYLRLKDSDNKIRVADYNIDYIIEVNDNTVYYFSLDSVYSYNLTDGSKKLLTAFEWNFTNKNKIFVF